MSTHAVSGSGPTGMPGLLAAVTGAIRAPDTVLWDQATATATYVFTPDLSSAESVTFTDLVAAFRQHEVAITLAEYQAIKPDLALLKTYAGIASPTLAQTVAATKAQSRILRAMLRD